MVRLPDDEKKFEDTFIRFDRIHEHDIHCTMAVAALVYSIAWQKVIAKACSAVTESPNCV